MGRANLLFLTASLVVHVGIGAGGVWLAHRGDVHGAPRAIFAGETFDIASVEATPLLEPREVVEQETPAERGDMQINRVSVRRPTTKPLGATAPELPPLTYGAVGDRTASSLLVTLSRGFPQAASTDDIWRTVPLGDAGSATMEIELNEDGTVARWSLGSGASVALRQAMVRTMGLVGGRPFIATGAVTKLRLEAHVTTDAVREGSDAVYAIHSEHEGNRADAYFSLSVGRRIDLVITALK